VKLLAHSSIQAIGTVALSFAGIIFTLLYGFGTLFLMFSVVFIVGYFDLRLFATYTGITILVITNILFSIRLINKPSILIFFWLAFSSSMFVVMF